MTEPIPPTGPSLPVPIDEIAGVVATHDPRPPIARAIAAVADTIRRSDEPASAVVVDTAGGAVSVWAALTTDIEGSTPQIARSVADELLAQYPAAELVSVQVRRIGPAR